MRIRYINHIINLIVQVFLFSDIIKIEKLKSYDEQKQKENIKTTDDKIIKIQFKFLKSLSKKHNIVIYIRKSAGRTAEFKELAERMIPINNRTR
jgi:hypothetical protein